MGQPQAAKNWVFFESPFKFQWKEKRQRNHKASKQNMAREDASFKVPQLKKKKEVALGLRCTKTKVRINLLFYSGSCAETNSCQATSRRGKVTAPTPAIHNVLLTLLDTFLSQMKN